MCESLKLASADALDSRVACLLLIVEKLVLKIPESHRRSWAFALCMKETRALLVLAWGNSTVSAFMLTVCFKSNENSLLIVGLVPHSEFANLAFCLRDWDGVIYHDRKLRHSILIFLQCCTSFECKLIFENYLSMRLNQFFAKFFLSLSSYVSPRHLGYFKTWRNVFYWWNWQKICTPMEMHFISAFISSDEPVMRQKQLLSFK
jgi:hypothetical protein